MDDILTYEEAVDIFTIIRKNMDRSDPDVADLYDDLFERAARYTSIRAGWNLLSREEKMEGDSTRTMIHNSFINSVNIIARLQGETGDAWRARLGDDRKRIGDFACYVTAILGVEAR